MDQSHDSLNNQETFSSEYTNTYKLHNHCEQTTPNEKPLEPPQKKEIRTPPGRNHQNHKSNVSQAPKSLELKPKQTSNLPPGRTQFCNSTSQ
jgi:hypothetical protein